MRNWSPIPTIFLALVTIAGLTYGVRWLRIDASVEAMSVDNDPDQAFFDEMKGVFGNDESILIGVRSADALAPKSLQGLRALTERLEALPHVLEVESLTTVDDPISIDGDLSVTPLVPPVIDDRASEWVRGRVAAVDLYRGTLISNDQKVALATLRLEDLGGDEGSRASLISAIRESARDTLGDSEFVIGGHPFMKVEIAHSMQRDLARFVPVSTGLMVVILWLATTSLVSVAVGLLVMTASIGATLGLMGWLGRPITAVTNVIPALLLALSTAYVLHVLFAVREEWARGGTSHDSVRRALRHVARPTLMAGLTTVIGFGVQGLSSIAIVRDFGLFLAFGLAVGTALSLTVAPALLSVIPIPRNVGSREIAWLRRPLWRVGRIAANRRWVVMMVAIGCLGFSAFGITRLAVDSSGPSYFSEESEFRRSMTFFAEHFGGDLIENVYLVGRPGSFENPAKLERLLDLERELEALPEVGRAISIADWVREMNSALGEEGRIPKSDDAVAQLLLLYESSGQPGALSELRSHDASAARVVVTARVQSSSESRRLREKMTALAMKYFPEETGPSAVVSTEMLLSKASDVLAIEQTKELMLSAALILGLLFLQLGWRDGLMATPPNVLPVAMVLGIMGFGEISLNVGTSLIASAALGIAVDDTMHLMERVNDAKRFWRGRVGAVLEGIMTVGRPVVFVWASVTLGFLVLVLSDFAVIRDLGLLMATCMTLCLLGDLFLLPALLLSFGDRSSGRLEIESDVGEERRRGVRLRVEEPLMYLTHDRKAGWGWAESLSQEGARVVTRDGPIPRGEIQLLWVRGQRSGARGRVLRVAPRSDGHEFAVAFDLQP
jgi:predicted RND superfamily exporter protein